MCNIVLCLKTSLFVCPFKNLLSKKTALSLSFHCSEWTLGFWAVPAGFYVWGTLALCLNSPVTATSCGHKILMVTWHWRPSSGSECQVVGETWTLSLCIFRTCGSPQVCPHCLFLVWRVLSGLDEWKLVWSGLPAWAVSWSSSQHHTAPRMLCCVRAVHVKLPLEPSTATDSRDCEGAAGFLYTFVLAALLTWSPGTDQT